MKTKKKPPSQPPKKEYPSIEITYPTLGKGTSPTKVPLGGKRGDYMLSAWLLHVDCMMITS